MKGGKKERKKKGGGKNPKHNNRQFLQTIQKEIETQQDDNDTKKREKLAP